MGSSSRRKPERPTDPPESAARQVGQLGRAVAVMDVVADLGVTSAAEVGRRLGLAKSTIHRLLNVLQVHGLVVRADGGFRLGERALGWVDRERTVSAARLRRLALPHLVELHRRAGVAVALGTMSQDAVAYPERIYDLTQLSEISPLLPLAPAHATATGKVLLAFNATSESRYPDEWPLSGYTPATITSPKLLAEEFSRIREAGLAASHGELFPGMTAVAVPVTDHLRRVVAAVGIAGPADRVFRPGVARMTRATGAAISAALRSAHAEHVPAVLRAGVAPA